MQRQGSDFAVGDERDIGRSDYCVSIVVAPMGMPCFLHELVGVNGTRDAERMAEILSADCRFSTHVFLRAYFFHWEFPICIGVIPSLEARREMGKRNVGDCHKQL